MLIYADRSKKERVSSLASRILDIASQLKNTSEAAQERDLFLQLFMESSELVQGILDRQLEIRGYDEWGAIESSCSEFMLEAASLFIRSNQEQLLPFNRFKQLLLKVVRDIENEQLCLKIPEGYVYYALYPETYLFAARELRSLNIEPLVVLGIRTIGTGLAALVAEETRSILSPLTVRPSGHPFNRTLRLGPMLSTKILSYEQENTHYAIVDEGPGLSGSSFGAVADWLEERGVCTDRIHFFPSHEGEPGIHASDRHRSQWRQCRRHSMPFHVFFRRFGKDEFSFMNKAAAIEDLSAGAWRSKIFPSENQWAPVNRTRERYKYLIHSSSGERSYLAKFEGLGKYGAEKWKRAKALAEAGFIPPVHSIEKGFLLSEWIDEAQVLSCGESRLNRPYLIEFLSSYLSYLCKQFPASKDGSGGASPSKLFSMGLHNLCEFGEKKLAENFQRWEAHLPALYAEYTPIKTDNKMHAWEWLVLPSGRLYKTDALDHHDSHDLIGAQNIDWDLVGAVIELNLSVSEKNEIEGYLARFCEFTPNPLRFQFYLECYLIYQMAYFMEAASILAPEDSAERFRLDRMVKAYRLKFRHLYGAGAKLGSAHY